MTAPAVPILSEESHDFYVRSMLLLQEKKVPFLVGGAYAFARYTGIERHTKDFDIFIRREDFDRAAAVLKEDGCRTELTFPHWIGKAYSGEDFIDLIFGAGNGVARVDELWFQHAVSETVLGVKVSLIPPEEMLWSKGLIMERERFDGADVAHVIEAVGARLDYRRLIDRYGVHWRALYAHLILFGYIYPAKRANVPAWVLEELGSRLANETSAGNSKENICYGSIVSRQQYLHDIGVRGLKDARLQPIGTMSAKDIAVWTKGIEVDGAK